MSIASLLLPSSLYRFNGCVWLLVRRIAVGLRLANLAMEQSARRDDGNCLNQLLFQKRIKSLWLR
jgi:hypothetical protein